MMKNMMPALVVLVLTAGVAEAQNKVPLPDPKCGELSRNNSGHQYGDGKSPWLEYIVETIRSASADCIAQVKVTGVVQGVSGSAAASEWETYAAAIRRPVQVPDWNTYFVAADHYFSMMFVPYDMGKTTSNPIEVKYNYGRDDEPPPTDVNPILAHEDPSCPECADPIIVDPRRDGFRLTSAKDGVLFDLDADGVPEQVAWTHADSDDAWLALDRNGNGRIDDGSELFGNRTPVNSAKDTASNGFTVLRFFDDSPFGKAIDSSDTVYARLVLWRDANHNGISEPDELTRVSDAGLASISTDYRTARRRDRFGNEFLMRAKGVWADGEFFIYDVWLKRQ
jgi:hypothetical protein